MFKPKFLNKVSRLTVVDENGRQYEKHNIKNIIFDLQDDKRTLKIFINHLVEENEK